MKGTRDTGIPEFQSLEEERKYWEARGPLAEGHKGIINKPKSGKKRSSFLAIRLTGEELTHLRDVAAEQGLGPSTFARVVLTRVIERKDSLPKVVTSDELMSTLSRNLSQEDKDKFESFLKDIVIGDPDNPALLVFSGQRKTWEEHTSLFLQRLLALLGIQVITPENEGYERIKDVAKSKTERKEEISI